MATESIYGVWWTPDNSAQRVPGHLTWDPPNSPYLEVLDPPRSFDGFGGHETVPLILGDVARFGWMTLLNSRYAGMQLGLTSTRTLCVGQAISRLRIDYASEPFCRRIEMEVPSLALVLGRHPIQLKTPLSSRSREARVTLEKCAHSWTSDGVEVKAWYCWRNTPSDLGIDLRMSPQLYLSTPKSRPFGYWMEEWLVPLSVLLNVATASHFRPRSVRLWTKKGISRYERSTDDLELWSAGIDPTTPLDVWNADPESLRPLVSIEQLRDVDMDELLGRTRQFAETYEVFWSLLASVLRDIGRPLRNRYLDVVAALEAFDSQLHGIGPMEIGGYKTESKRALDTVEDRDARKFFKRWVRGRPEYSLHERLRRAALSVDVELKQDAQTMAAVRNDIAHGNAHPDPHLLRDCHVQAVEVARRLALAEMGLG